MRKIILSVLTLITASSLSAQKFELGLNGGIGFNTAPAIQKDGIKVSYSGMRGSAISPAASFNVLYISRNWQYGLSLGYAELSYRYNDYPNFFLPPTSGTQVPETKVTTPIAKPTLPFKLSASRRLVFRRLETYGGISAGYCSVANSKSPDFHYEAGTTTNGSGWLAGAQAGGTYFVSKHFGINGEAAANYMSIDVKSTHYALWQFPFTLGIRYKL